MAEAFIPIAIFVGGVGMLAAAGAREAETARDIRLKAKREDEESKGEEVPKIVIKIEGIREKILRESEEHTRTHMETLEKLREKRRDTLEKLREKEKILENQFIDEFPELSLQERVDLSRKLVRVKAEW
jgi:hypothetical protein